MSLGVFFLIERGAEFSIAPYVSRHLGQHPVSVGDVFPVHPEDYRIVVLWNLRRVLRDLPASRNLLVFHSSDLPRGRGWAPLYHALADGGDQHVITALFAAAEVDAGHVLAKARFRLQSCHTADNLRPIDEEVCIMLAAAILERYPDRLPAGVPQCGQASYHARRSPADSAVDPGRPLADLIPHLRACCSGHRAFFDWRGCRYRIEITPEETPGIPDDLRFEFADDIHFP